MKKVTKKSLDELAKVMPPLSVQEQRSCIGGSIYYSPGSGSYLGAWNDGFPDIRVINPDDFYELTRSGSAGGVTGASIGNELIRLSSKLSSNDSMLSPIYSVMAQSIGYNGVVGLIPQTPENRNKYGAAQSGSIYLNPSLLDNNFYNTMSILVHEKHHCDTPEDNSDTNKSEFEAYKAMINSAYFANATEGFQKLMREKYEYYKGQVASGNRT